MDNGASLDMEWKPCTFDEAQKKIRQYRRGYHQDEKNCVEGYIIDPRGKVRGEARNYDPYARFGEIMLMRLTVLDTL